MKSIGSAELKRKMEQGADLVLIDVLDSQSFANYHIAGAVNVPLGHDFVGGVQNVVADKGRMVVVYCTNARCTASTQAAKIMEERLGFTNVWHFAGGKEEWRDEGFPVESSTGRERPEDGRMPEVADCQMVDCAYNEERHCHAMAITVGGPHPRCDTFLRGFDKGGSTQVAGRVGACKVVNCTHNESLECSAEGISVAPHEMHPDCTTFSPRAR